MAEDWQVAATVATETEAHLVAGFLRNEEIEARIEVRSFRQEPVNLGRMADVRVLVREPDLAPARRLLEERRSRFLVSEEGA
jgi:hypothetical protein